MQDSKVAFFSPLRYDRIYQRPQTLFDKLAARGHEVYYFQGPYKKGSLNHSRFGYHLPPAVECLDDHRKIVTVPRYFDFFGLTLRFTRGCMEKHVARWMGKFMDRCMGPEVIAFVESFSRRAASNSRLHPSRTSSGSPRSGSAITWVSTASVSF